MPLAHAAEAPARAPGAHRAPGRRRPTRCRSTCASSPRRTATSRRAVEEERFREDLFFRINVIHVDGAAAPRARQRRAAARAALRRALRGASRQAGDAAVAGARRRSSLAYRWPGNVRELQNCIERAVALTRYEHIIVDDLPETVRDYRPIARAERDRRPLRARPAGRGRASLRRCACSRPSAATRPPPRRCSGCPARRCTASSRSTARAGGKKRSARGQPRVPIDGVKRLASTRTW